MICDALDLKGVEGVLDGCDAAISTLGGAPEGDEQKRVDYVGNRNVIESAGILGITRLVLVTSVGCGSSRGSITDKVYQVRTTTSMGKSCFKLPMSTPSASPIIQYCSRLILRRNEGKFTRSNK